MAFAASKKPFAVKAAGIEQALFGTAHDSQGSLLADANSYQRLGQGGFIAKLVKSGDFVSKFGSGNKFNEAKLANHVFANLFGTKPSAGFLKYMKNHFDQDAAGALKYLLNLNSVKNAINALATPFVEVAAVSAPEAVPYGDNLKTADYNDAPTSVTASATIVAEAAIVGAPVATLTATDADAGDTHTFTLLNGASVPFEIIDNKIVVKESLVDNEDFDAEQYVLSVQATDSKGEKSPIIQITLTVTDDDTAPPPPNLLINLKPGAETVDGGAGDDTFTGDEETSLNDSIDGKGGTDTLALRLGDNDVVETIETVNVEIVEITNSDHGTATVVATQMIGVEDFRNVNSQGDVKIRDVQFAPGQEFHWVDPSDDDQTFTIDFDATGPGALPVDADGEGTGSTTVILDEVGTNGGEDTNFDLTLTQGKATDTTVPANLANLNIVSTKGPNFIDDLESGTRKITISGDADLQLGDENVDDDDLIDDNENLQEIDASGLDADLQVELDDDDGDEDDVTIKYLGALGDDRVQMGDIFDDGANSRDTNGDGILDLQTFDGNTGDNVLVFEDFADIGGGDGLNGVVKNFQTAEFEEEVGNVDPLNARATLRADQLDGVRIFDLAGGVVDASLVQIIGLDPDQTHTVIVADNGAVDATMDFQVGDPETELFSGPINGTSDKIVLDQNDADLDITLLGDEIETFEYQRASNAINTVTLGESMTDLTLFQLTGNNLPPDLVIDFTFNAGSEIVKSNFVYDGSASNADQQVTGVNLGTVKTGAGNDIVLGSGNAGLVIETNDGDDLVIGLDGQDLIKTGAGNDTARGGREDDTLLGGSGDDNLNGDSGDDYIDGGEGADIMTGGAPVAHVVTATVGGFIGNGDKFELFIDENGNGVKDGSEAFASVTVAPAQVGNPAAIAAALAAAAGPAFGGNYTVSAVGSDITVTRADGVAFNLGKIATDGAPADSIGFDTATITVANGTYDRFDVVSVTINGTQFNYVVPADGQTAADVAAGLNNKLNGNAFMSNSVAGNVISLTGLVQGTNYTVALTTNPNGPVLAGGTNTVDNSGAGIDNAEPVPASYQIGTTTQFENPGDNFSIEITGQDGVTKTTFSITQSSANLAEAILNGGPPVDGNNDTGTEALQNLLNAQEANILAALGLSGTGADIQVIGTQGSSAGLKIVGPSDGSAILKGAAAISVNLTDGGGDPIDVITNGPELPGDQVTANTAPTVVDGTPQQLQDDTQNIAIQTTVVGETGGNDTFVVKSSDQANPFNLVGDNLDRITDFEADGRKSTGDVLVFDGATKDGFTNLVGDPNEVETGDITHFLDLSVNGSVPLLNYASAYAAAAAALSALSNSALDYVMTVVDLDGNLFTAADTTTYVFADVNGDNVIDDAASFTGIVGIKAEDIQLDTNPIA